MHWSEAPALPAARFEAYAAVANDKIYFIGGITGVFGDIRTAAPSRRVDVFDPRTGAWSAGPELPIDAPKHHLTVTVVNDAIYVLGGFDGIIGQTAGEPFRPIARAYVLEGSTWRLLAPPPLARGGATAQAIDGRLYVAGGAPNEGEPSYAQLDIYDVASNAWTTGRSMPTAREHVASCAIDGTMIVVGGWNDHERAAQAAVERYDPRSDLWTTLAPLPTRRGGLAAVTIGSSCHVVGGEDWALPLPGTFASHETLEFTKGTWEIDVPMPTARHGLGLAWLEGRLYAVGGGPSQGNSYTAVVEVLGP
ncbi:MAG: Kelch repeat type 1-containing protein [Labilithrix sp.]|nr:Kelch repeat type 1-containing protein [Labilithrix sp.]